MQEPAIPNSTSRVFLLAFQGAEIFYSTEEHRVFSALAPRGAEATLRPAAAEAAKPDRKAAR